MKRVTLFLPIMLLLSLSAFANSVNLSTGSYSQGVVYTFSAGSYYAQYFGTGIGLVQGESYNSNGWNYFEAWSGTAAGNITHFANTYLSMADFSGTFSNATFNSKTDVLTAAFSGSEFNGTTWVPFKGHLKEVFNLSGGAYNGGGYNYTVGSVTSASMSSVPEPGSLMLMGTGLVGMVGAMRRKLVKR
jgi:hypothetical protein